MRLSRTIYAVMAWLFVAGVATQVFFAGMTVVANRWGWDNHVQLGHTLAAPLVLMLVTMYVGKLPGGMKRLTWLLFGVYILQADVLIFMRASAPVLAALHPVLALVDFALGVMLARQAMAVVRTEEPSAARQLQPDGVSGD